LNEGNTCFAAATLQMLARTTPFAQTLMEMPLAAPQQPLRTVVRLLMQHIFDGGDSLHNFKNTSVQAAAKGDMKGAMRPFFPHLFDGRQHDAHEYLIGLLDSLDAEAKAVDGRPSWVDTVCTGKLGTRVRCVDCGHTITKEEPMAVLTVPLADAARATLHERIDRMTAAERIAEYKCDGCGKKGTVETCVAVSAAPEVLFVHLLRFEQRLDDNGDVVLDKRRTPTDIPDSFNLPTMAQTAVHYRLCGLVVHLGQQMENGHYVAALRESTGSWRVLDDEKAFTCRNFADVERKLKAHEQAFLAAYVADR
jgi:ubiquitin C-terminal hydrolase